MQIDNSLPWRKINDKGFNTHIGPIHFARADDRTWFGYIDLIDFHMNVGGVCHGGVYMALADVTMGAAAYEAGGSHRCATIEMDSHFLAAAKQGQRLIAHATLNRRVSGLAFMQADLTAGGRQCLRASGIWKFLASEQPKYPDRIVS